ncbi:MAG: tRNA pseudouridine55 synthase [Patescibacteria group bacterium]|nr:tRNA pseudouridine55 synthase [Patescibacteria group bacterium]
MEQLPLPEPIRFNPNESIKELPEDGLYLFDKPVGISSFGAVYQVRLKLKQIHGKKIKVGHCGTLDPIASGLLILVSGKLTKRAGELTKMDKVYEAEATLGSSSTTYDSEGTLSPVSTKKPSLSEVKTQLVKFKGKIEQTPPIFSAIKIDGKRAYKLAREGKPVAMKPRQVEVYSIELIKYSYPLVKFKVHVSSGTYIRSLIDDLGKNLKVGAHMSGLRRISISKYHL